MAKKLGMTPSTHPLSSSAFKPGHPRPANAGRKKGIPNKITMNVKEALVEAFEKMGGVPSLVRWGRLNTTEFYKLWVRLLPVQVTGAEGKALIPEAQYDLKNLGIDELTQLSYYIEKITKAKPGADASTVVAGLMHAAEDEAEEERATDPLTGEQCG